MGAKNAKLLKAITVETCLKLVALLVVVSMFLKSIIDVDPHYDTWVYHLPFAARLWGIVPAQMYAFEANEEVRFDGFPVLAEFGQGFFWFVFGRVQAANLVCFLSLILYLCFLKGYFKIPLYLSAIALLAIPLVQTHATTCYVDLPGNLALSALIMMTYRLYTDKHYSTRDLLTIFITAACAANIKPQLVPLVFVVLCFTLPRIVWLQAHQKRHALFKWLRTFLPAVSLALLLIFATPIKNIALHGNPFYPVRIEIAGKVLNHAVGQYSAVPEALENASRPQIWLYSLLEINAPSWSVDQWNGGNPNLMNRMGGFFGAYVVFNVLLLGYLFVRDRRRTFVAVATMVVVSVVAANFPQSHELRYFMYWAISLVSINLFLVCRDKPGGLINPKNLGIVCVLALAIVIARTEALYVRPMFFTLDRDIQKIVTPDVLAQINPGEKVCLVGMQPYTFLYASKFHPQLNYSYSVKAAGEASGCGTYRPIEKQAIEP